MPAEGVVAFPSWSWEAKEVRRVPSCLHHFPGVLSQLHAETWPTKRHSIFKITLEIHCLCPCTWHRLSFIQSIPKEHGPWTMPYSRKLEVEKEALRPLAKLWNTLIWTSGLLGWKSLLPRLRDQVFTACHADITDHWDMLPPVFSGFSCSFWGFFQYLHIYMKRSVCKICAKYFRVSYHIFLSSGHTQRHRMDNTGAKIFSTSTVQHPATQITWIWQIYHRFAVFHMHTYFCQELMIYSSGLLLPHTLCPPCLQSFYHLQARGLN